MDSSMMMKNESIHIGGSSPLPPPDARAVEGTSAEAAAAKGATRRAMGCGREASDEQLRMGFSETVRYLLGGKQVSRW